MILVTGGTGFLGSHLLLHLVKNKISPVATYRTKNKINFVRIFFMKMILKVNHYLKKSNGVNVISLITQMLKNLLRV